MPFKSKEQHREFQRTWVARRRREWFAGKRCESCGSGESLELDHIDPAKKVSHKIWSWSASRRTAELAKCRPLCAACHKARSDAQLRKPLVHGTTTYYRRGCRCEVCRAAQAEYRKLRAATGRK